jgi:hypothetical protein
MNEFILIGILVLGGIAMAKAAKGASGMSDKSVSIENIRRGVAQGWYTARLTHKNGKPAIFLSGRTADGKVFSDVYPIAQADWDALKAEGYAEA